jgi:hypothetical protein
MKKHIKRPPSHGAPQFPDDIREIAREKVSQGKRLNLLQDIVFKDVFSADDDDSRTALRHPHLRLRPP